MEIKQARSKDYYHANKKKLQNISHEYYKNLYEDEKIKTRNNSKITLKSIYVRRREKGKMNI